MYTYKDWYGEEPTTETLLLQREWGMNFEWENIEVAKENLKRIKNHYLWYNSLNGYSPKPDFVAEDEPWFSPNAKDRLKLLCSDGQEIEISPPWCGHFESLITASIVVPEWRIEF